MSIKRDAPWAPKAYCELCGEEVGLITADTGRKDDTIAPVHLCPSCREGSVWCQGHMKFHYKNEPHQRLCPRCKHIFKGQAGYVALCPSCVWETQQIKRTGR